MWQKVRDEAQVEGRATVMHEAHLNAGDEVMKRSRGGDEAAAGEEGGKMRGRRRRGEPRQR